MNKQLVSYKSIDILIKVCPNTKILIYPADHPSSYVSNTNVCLTSLVLSFCRDSGKIETQNTIYTPLDDKAYKSFIANIDQP